MSLLSAVLQEADKVSIEEFKKCRSEILPKIKELTERIELLSWTLQQNFIDTYANFTTTKSLEQLLYKTRKNAILSEYENLFDEIKSIHNKFNEIDDEFKNCCEKMNKSFSILKELSIAVEGKRLLEQANSDFGRHNYNAAMLTVMELQKQLQTLNYAGDLYKALINLKAQAENQFALYSANISVMWEDIFNWTENKYLYHLTYSLSVEQKDPILIQKVLKTLYVTERLNAELGLFSHFFIDKLLHNVIRHNCDIFTEEHIGAIVFNIKIDLNDVNKPHYQTIFNNLMAIFEFLQSTLGAHFDCDKKFIAVFANSIREKFFNKIIEDCIRNNLPSCDSSYDNYKNLVTELDSFNKFLIDLEFVESNASPLNKYIEDTECVLYNRKCDKLISDVRNLLNQSLSYKTIVVGSSIDTESDTIMNVTDKDAVWDIDRPLFLSKCVISQNVKNIMMMIIQHLEESVKLPEKYNKQLMVYVKDIAVMYQTIVPKKFKVNLEHCPLDIALYFNNCFYLAHGLVGPPWKSILPFSMANHFTTILVECIQDLRVIGLQKLSLYLQNQKSFITQNIETNESASWTYDSYEQFDSAVNNAIILMKDLKSTWYDVLPSRMYVMSMCTLVETLCQSILHRIFANTKSISEELVYMLAIKLIDTVAEVKTLFEDPIDLDKKITTWNKYTKMPQLLTAQLLEISELWKKDKQLSQCYTCEQVRQVVKMRFPDNDHRLKILKEIQ